MGADIADSVEQIQKEKNISEELVLKTIEETLVAAYKRKFGTAENAVVRFSDDRRWVYLYARKRIVEDDDWDDPALEIELTEAKALNEEAEIGDELLIEIDPKTFDSSAVQSAKQKARQDLREIQKDTLYSEFKDKRGEIIIGYHQRERNGNIYLDLGKTEGVLPKRFQSPRESYRTGDRIKTLIWEVNKSPGGLSIVLSRTHPEFVKRILELEVPEIYDGAVEIYKIVREAGYRTKLAVFSHRDDIDPVGACVGVKGQRIQTIVRELEGEKIDILKYDPDPAVFIKNALSPAQVLRVFIVDAEKKQALAVLAEDQLSLAIGKQGLNVRLANRLADWSIDVKTEAQFAEMDVAPELAAVANTLFNDASESEITGIAELPGIPGRIVELLRDNGVELIETLVSLSKEELEALNGMTESDAALIQQVISDTLDIYEEPEEEPLADQESDYLEISGKEDETYECPECGELITVDMKECPNCGVGLSFEEEEGF